LGPLVELASDLDSINIEMPKIRPVNNDNDLREITQKFTDGHTTHL
jgi:hypothetical protein